MGTRSIDDLDVRLTEPGLYLRDDWFEILRLLRDEDPVHRTADGVLAVTRYDDVRAISRDPARFVSGKGVLVNDPLRDPDGKGDNTGSLLHLDPPLHGAYRSVVNRQFTPRAVAHLEADIRRTVRTVLDAAPVDEPIDFIEHVAAPVPITVISDFFGVPDADRELFRRWSDAAIASPDSLMDDDPTAGEDFAAMGAFLYEHIDSPATDGNDLLNLLKTTPVGDRTLDRVEIMGFCLTLLIAGNETTRHLVSGGIEALARHPDQRSALAADPTLMPGAIEEMLRWVTPIQAFGRTAVVDVELGDATVAAGEIVVMLYASANRDERAFGDTAGSFDVTRPVTPTHVAFGFGEHLCLGASLARLEARIFFEEMLARYPDYELAGDATYNRSTLVRGASHLPVVLSP